MYISSRVRHREGCYKVAECILHHLCITRKVGRRLRNVYIITCASQGKLLQGCRVYISSRVHHRESCFKVGKCIYHHVCITRKVVLKLQNDISSHVHHKESCYKVAKCIYYHVCVTRKVVVKLQNVYIMTFASQRKLL